MKSPQQVAPLRPSPCRSSREARLVDRFMRIAGPRSTETPCMSPSMSAVGLRADAAAQARARHGVRRTRDQAAAGLAPEMVRRRRGLVFHERNTLEARHRAARAARHGKNQPHPRARLRFRLRHQIYEIALRPRRRLQDRRAQRPVRDRGHRRHVGPAQPATRRERTKNRAHRRCTKYSIRWTECRRRTG